MSDLPLPGLRSDLVLRNCRRLQGSLAEVTVLGTATVTGCPAFDYREELPAPLR